MRNRLIPAFVSSLLLCLSLSLPVCASNDLKLIKENYKSILVPSAHESDTLWTDLIEIEPETEMSDQAVVELHQRYPFDLKKIKAYLSLMRVNGSWKDINYADTKRSGWEPKQHAERILELSKLYYSKNTAYYHSKEIKEAIHSALDYWFTAKPTCLNWWYNQIGIPKTLGAAFVLLEEQLSEPEKEAAIGVMNQAKFGMTGQNKVWLAGNVLIRALLQEDKALVRSARDVIASEIVTGGKEGIKNDWSFHQHGPQQQFGNYGLSFISGMSFFNRLFKGTEYEFDQKQKGILVSLINEGYRWIIWNRYMDVSSLGRQLFHHAQLHKAYSLAFAAADLGLGNFPKRGNTLVGHKHFDDSDYTVHRSKGWMASVKMASNRVIGTELINEDNLKGYYMGDGATYYYVRGDEYLDVFPFWDWRKVPGVTAYEDSDPIPVARGIQSGNKTDWVGGLGNGQCGMTAMELNRDGLKAYKAWLFTEGFVVCLGGSIQSDTSLCVTTSIDQRMKKGDLWVLEEGGWDKLEGRKVYSNREELRFFHDQTGYIVLGNDTCVLQAERRLGRWCDFMKMYRPATVEGEVVAFHFRHGTKPRCAGYQYLVFPNMDKDKVKAFDVKNSVRVVRNDSVAQILSVPAAGQGYWMAVYRPVELVLDGKTFLPECPGIYYVERSGTEIICKLSSPFRTKCVQ